MIGKRLRVKHERSLQERLAEEAARFRDLSNQSPSERERQLYLRRARQAETAAHLDEWLNSPGLRPPAELLNLKPQSGR